MRKYNKYMNINEMFESIINESSISIDKKVTNIINSRDFKKFVNYFNSFYGKNGVYSSGKDIAEKDIIKGLYNVFKRNKKYEWGDGDSVDREFVRDELFKMKVLSDKIYKNESVNETFIPKVGTIDDFKLKDLLMKNPKVNAVLGNNEKSFMKKSDVVVIMHQSKRFNTIFTDGKQEFEIDMKVGKLVKPLGKARKEIVTHFSKSESVNEEFINEGLGTAIQKIRKLAVSMANKKFDSAQNHINLGKLSSNKFDGKGELNKAEASLSNINTLDEGLRSTINNIGIKLAKGAGILTIISGMVSAVGWSRYIDASFTKFYYSQIQRLAEPEVMKVMTDLYGARASEGTIYGKFGLIAFFIFFAITVIGIAAARLSKEKKESVNEDIKSDISKFVNKLNKQFPDQEYVVSSGGGKYMRINHKRANGGQESVWGFIALVDNPQKGLKVGDLLKAAGYNAPAKHSRGNILNGTAKYDKYSPTYLKESVNEANNPKFKKGDKVIVKNPHGNDFKGVVEFPKLDVKIKGIETLVSLKGAGGVWDSKYLTLDESVNESVYFNGYVSSTDGKTFTLYNSDKKKIKNVSFDELKNKYMKTYLKHSLIDFKDKFDKTTGKGKYYKYWKGKLVNVKLSNIGESVNEAKFGYTDSTASYINKHNNEYKIAEKMNKGNEQKFYDELETLEGKIGRPKTMVFISNALRGYGVDMYKDPKIKTPADAQEALFLLSR